MKNNFNPRAALPHLVVILVFAAITIAFFMPLFQGKGIRQGDIIQHKGMSKEIVDHRAEFNEEPLWTNSMFGGMPAYQISVLYKNNLMKYVDKVMSAGMSSQARYFFLYLVGFYILMVVLKVRPWIGLIGSVAFAFSTYFLIIIEAGHNSKAHAIGYMAPVIAGFILTYRGKYLLGGALTALFLALQLYTNHLQITYYLGFILVAVGIAELVNAVKESQLSRFLKASGVIVAAAIIALGTSAGNLMTTYEYGKYTTRGTSELTIAPGGGSNAGYKTTGLDKDYVTGWSYGKDETMTLLIPNFQGGASGAIGNDKDVLAKVDPQMKQIVSQMDSYWGDQSFTSGPVYVGAIIMFLGLLGMFILRGPLKWALLGVTILAIMLAWGRHFMGLTDFFLDHFPGYNKFRTVTMILVIAELTIPLLATLALNELVTNAALLKEKVSIFGKSIEKQKLVIASFVLTGGICLWFYLSPGSADVYKAGEFDSLMSQVREASPEADNAQLESYVSRIYQELGVARKAMLKSDAGRSFVFILLAAGLVWFFMRGAFNKWVLIAGVGVLVIIDMWTVNRRYINSENYVTKRETETVHQPTAANEAILKDRSIYRVLNLTVSPFQDAGTSYFHQSIGGYHGAKLKRYQEMIEFYISGEIGSVISTLRTNPTDSAINKTLSEQGTLNMLNTKYIIYNPSAPPLQNRYALGNAWFVSNLKTVANADEEIIETGKIDPAATAVVDDDFKSELGGLPASLPAGGEIKLMSYKPNHLVYESNASADQLAVFSEIWYPAGWNVTIDGKEASFIRANYILRAMKVPAGKHTIEFRFEPKSYHTGETISLASSILLILLVLGTAIAEIRKQMAS